MRKKAKKKKERVEKERTRKGACISQLHRGVHTLGTF